MLTKLQKILFYLLVAVTPFVMFPRTSELFEFNKMMFIYVLTLGIASLWLIRSILEKKPLFTRSPLNIPIVLHLIVMGVSTLFSIDHQTSLWGYYGRFNGGYVSLLSYISLFYALIYLLREEGERAKDFIRCLIMVSIAAATGVIAWGLPGKAGADLSCLLFVGKFDNACWTSQFEPASRMFSTLGQPNWLGAYLAIQFCFGLYLFFRSIGKAMKDRVPTYLYGGFLVLSYSAILFTRSRSALGAVSAVALLGLAWFLLATRQLGAKQKFKAVGVILCGILAAIVVFKTGVQKIDVLTTPGAWFPKKSVATAQPKPAPVPYVSSEISESFDIRKIVWQGALQLGSQYPLFGTGPETFAYAYYFVRPVAHNMTSEWDYLYNKAHNEYLNYFATTGYSGLGTYLLMICVVVFMAIRMLIAGNKETDEKLLAAFALLAYITILITNGVGFSTTTINIFFYLLPVIFMAFAVAPGKKHPEPVTTTDKILVGGILVFFIAGMSFLYNYWSADVQYAAADSFSRTNDYQTAVGLLDKALKSHYEHVYEDKLSYSLSNLAFLAYYQHDTQTADRLMKLAEHYNTKSLDASSQNVLYWKTNAKNQYVFYQITLNKEYLKKGIQALTTAAALSPTDPKLPYFLATYNSLLWDEEKDREVKKAVEETAMKQVDLSIVLKPDYQDAYMLKAQLYKKFGKRQDAKSAYETLMKRFHIPKKDLEKEMEGL